MVLLKGYDKTGFKFFTNYSSRKASELVRDYVNSQTVYFPLTKLRFQQTYHLDGVGGSLMLLDFSHTDSLRDEISPSYVNFILLTKVSWEPLEYSAEGNLRSP
jgi:hypothetical protein